MDPRKLFFDERHRSFCAYCGGEPITRDHVPSKVLLDDPLPNNLPVVGACRRCNDSFSRDEQYVACLIECVIVGSTNPAAVRRDKVRRTLRSRPALAALIEASRRAGEKGNILWQPDQDRVRSLLLKLGRGHAAFHLAEPQLGEPRIIEFAPIQEIPNGRLREFEASIREQVFPEIGSRAFVESLVVQPNVVHNQDTDGEDEPGLFLPSSVGDWEIVQPGRYRYALSYSDGIEVRLVLSEYLAGIVAW